MMYRAIRDEFELRAGDVAVYAHPSDMVPRLCLRVRAGIGQDRAHEAIDGRLKRDVQNLGAGDHRRRVVLEITNDFYYTTDVRSDVFIVGYRFMDKDGHRRRANASELLYVVDRELRREI